MKKKIKIVKKEDENFVFEKAKNGCAESKKVILDFFEPIVMQMAYKYYPLFKGMQEFQDIKQEAKIAILLALKNYAIEKDTRSNYARFVVFAKIYIVRYLILFLEDHSRIVRLPNYVSKEIVKLKKQKIENHEAYNYEEKTISYTENSFEKNEVYMNPYKDSIVDLVMHMETKEIIDEIKKKCLTYKQIRYINKYYSDDDVSYSDLAKEFGYTRNSAFYIIKNSIERLECYIRLRYHKNDFL